VATETEEQLAWEARQRPRAAIAAALAGVLTLTGGIGVGALFRDVPRADYLDSLGRAVQPGPVGSTPSLRTPLFEYYDDRLAGLFATSLATALGLLGMGLALYFLALATRARRAELPRWAIYLPLAGGGLSALATIMRPIATSIGVKDFLDGPRTVDAAQEVFSSGLGTAAGLVGLFGSLFLGLAFVLVGLNAMRAGLLTRFMGILGIIVGVLVVVPLGSPLPIVQCFWLFAFSLLLLGRLPTGVPPAWETGQAHAWPSSAEVRAERRRAMEERQQQRRGGAPPEEPAPAAEEETVGVGGEGGTAHPSSKKRKRKRRT
jgi:hypothetical protein